MSALTMLGGVVKWWTVSVVVEVADVHEAFLFTAVQQSTMQTVISFRPHVH